MNYTLESPFLQFTLHPDRASWNLSGFQGDGPVLEDVCQRVWYRRGRTRYQALDSWQPYQLRQTQAEPSAHGPMRQIALVTGPDDNELRYTLTFALPQERPIFLWKLVVENNGSEPVLIDRLEMLRSGPIPGEPEQDSRQPRIRNLQSNLAFFSNGWQSWNYTGVYGSGDRYRRTRLGFLTQPMRVNAGTPHPKDPGHFGSDMFGVLGDRDRRFAVLAGFLSQQEHFGSLEAWTNASQPALRLWANGDGTRLDPGSTCATDWACLNFLNLEDVDPLAPYLEAVASQHGIAQRFFKEGGENSQDIPTGWSSWYYFFHKVTDQDVRDNLQAAASLRQDIPLDLIQIDDGFESQVGDWFSYKPTFPDGVAPLAKEIAGSGFTPGLWLAPYILHPGSRLASEHPDWLLRGRFNRPVNAGYTFWGAFATALDLTHPDALAYTVELIYNAAHVWGYPYLKLDFLYAAALPGHYRDPRRTRAQVLRAGLQALRSAAGDETFLLGCGCPLGPAIGMVDAMRIGADVSDRWLPAYLGTEIFIQAEPDYPSVRNTIQNALTRVPLHRRWWLNDPDALLLRPDTRLTLAETRSLATVITMTGGLLLFSDNLPDLPPDRLQLAQILLPVIGQRPYVLDWFDSATPRRLRLDLENETGPWHLLALFNWEDHTQSLTLHLADFGLEEQKYWHARQFWNGRADTVQGGLLDLGQVPAHGTTLLAIRPYNPNEPRYLGSDLHISQGLEVAAWNWTPPGRLDFRLERPGHTQGTIELYLPSPPQRALLDGQPIQWQVGDEGRYRFSLQMNQTARIQIDLKP